MAFDPRQLLDDECVCQIAASFPILDNLGIISATLRTNVNVSITEGELILMGPTFGDLSITAYAPLGDEQLPCAGKASASFQWEQRTDCDWENPDTLGLVMITHFIPKGKSKSYMEGSITEKITMERISNYVNFSASAASGPHTPYIMTNHHDGYHLEYTGGPIQIEIEDQYQPKNIDIFEDILPEGTKLYLTSFSWEYNPPNIPNVSYAFLVSYDGG